MSDPTIEEVALQLKGKKVGELVLHHMSQQSAAQLHAAVIGMADELPSTIRNELEDIIDQAAPLANEIFFWKMDCGKATKNLGIIIRKEMEKTDIPITPQQVFLVFNCIIVNFAYSAHLDPQLAKFIIKKHSKQDIWITQEKEQVSQKSTYHATANQSRWNTEAEHAPNKMNIIMKLIYSVAIIVVGILISAVVKDLVGIGQFIVLGITVVILFKLWSK